MRPDQDAGYPAAADRKLTQPLGAAIQVILVFAGGLLATFLLLATWDHHVSIFGLGPSPLCGTVPTNGITLTGSSLTEAAHIKPGAYSAGGQLALCASHPAAAQRALLTLTQAPAVVFYLAVLLLLWRLLRTIGRSGPFATLVAGRLRFLGWFILAGFLVITVGESVAQSGFASTLVSDHVPVASNVINAVIGGFALPVLIACGLLTLARVIRVGAQMSEDLVGTV